MIWRKIVLLLLEALRILELSTLNCWCLIDIIWCGVLSAKKPCLINTLSITIHYSFWPWWRTLRFCKMHYVRFHILVCNWSRSSRIVTILIFVLHLVDKGLLELHLLLELLLLVGQNRMLTLALKLSQLLAYKLLILYFFTLRIVRLNHCAHKMILRIAN